MPSREEIQKAHTRTAARLGDHQGEGQHDDLAEFPVTYRGCVPKIELDDQELLRRVMREEIDNSPSEENVYKLLLHTLGTTATRAELDAGRKLITALLDGEFESQVQDQRANSGAVDSFIDQLVGEELLGSVIADIAASKEMRERPDIYG